VSKAPGFFHVSITTQSLLKEKSSITFQEEKKGDENQKYVGVTFGLLWLNNYVSAENLKNVIVNVLEHKLTANSKLTLYI